MLAATSRHGGSLSGGVGILDMVVAHHASKAGILVLVVGRPGKVGLERTIGPIGRVGSGRSAGAAKVLEVRAIDSDGHRGDQRGGEGCDSERHNLFGFLILIKKQKYGLHG